MENIQRNLYHQKNSPRKPMPSKYNPQIHHRRSIRLQGYDYTQAGAYFVTIDTWQKEHLFGEVVDGVIRLNKFGQIVQQAWYDLPNHYSHVELDAFCIMPNHIHGIIVLLDTRRGGSDGQSSRPARIISGTPPLPDITQTRPCMDRQSSRPARIISGTPPLPDITQTRPCMVGQSSRPANTMSGTPPLPEITQTRPCMDRQSSRPANTISGTPPLPDITQTRPYCTGPKRHGLPEIVRALKSFSARRINVIRRTPGLPVWQRNYYEHILRDDQDYTNTCQYILVNPQNWQNDNQS
jgi:putative transposase